MKNAARSNKSRLAQSLTVASGALASTAASSHGAVVQITLTGNSLSNTGGNQLVADLTGDALADVTFTGIGGTALGAAGFSINGSIVYASFSSYSSSLFRADAQFVGGGVGVAFANAFGAQNIKYLNPIMFTDSRINNGVATRGYLEVNAINNSTSHHTVALTRLVFDDASTSLGTSGLSTGTTYTEWGAVPEPSGIALLALGGGGLLARRRRSQQPA